MPRSETQIAVTPAIKRLVQDIGGSITGETLLKVRDRMFGVLEIRPYGQEVKEQEKALRWKRTAAEILRDGYVYNGKACTDLTVLFIALGRALNLETNFVKLKKAGKVHSVAEIKLKDGWYIFDVSNIKNIPVRGVITAGAPYQGWELWRKGRDAWDLGLDDFSSIEKIGR